MILHDPPFEEFRNQKRLDCREYRLQMDSTDVFGCFVEGNSETKNVDEIDEDIEMFRKSLKETLKSLTEQEMLGSMEALLKAKKCRDICLRDEVERNWAAIISETYVFDRLRREANAISSLTITDLKSLLIDCTVAEPSLHKLSFQVAGSGDYETSTVPTEGQNGGNVLPSTTNTDSDHALEYLTDSPSAEKKMDYYITDIEEYKRKRGVLSMHSSGV